ncbi:hypothetical protein J2T55_001632 [Methylohalomonas lacus]|uniref:ABC-type transport auxiliary lipoprotein component domain-containing protein n=1 Tax=Methylohalomonas lacus TaxID=398773 RepID=A0AAE3HLV0_9GAMM|nr:hypothetical protein [Methylohalomonas lacus]MCS3903603.1 hypothetical protein [Methylohalomonas lacus]
MKIAYLGLLSLLFLNTACTHQVTFDDPSHYSIATPRQDTGTTAVIDRQTLENSVPIRAFMTGIAHKWEAQPGDMLRQVADIELPQMFSDYEFVTDYDEQTKPADWIVLELAVPNYEFDEFRAAVSVRAIAYRSGEAPILDETYSAEGDTQGAKMFWAGAFGMKSAIRQSSLDAYQKIFVELRSDLLKALEAQADSSTTAAVYARVTVPATENGP